MIAPVIFIVLVLFFVLIGFGILKKRNAKKEVQFKDIALKYNLEFFKSKSFFEGTKLQLKGKYKDLPIEIYETIKGSGKHKVRYTNVSLACPDFGFSFSIGKENFLSRIGKWVGFNDIEFQDMQLDKTYLFKSKDESKFRALMTHDILAELSRIKLSMKGAINYDSKGLTYAMPVELTDSAKTSDLESILSFMGKLITKRNTF